MADRLTGKDLIAWGFEPGKWFADAIAVANAARARGADESALRALVAEHAPPPVIPLAEPGDKPFHANIEGETIDERDNISAVEKTMTELMRTPTIEAGAVMPDACPAGGLGVIPVGGVAAARGAIHPGMHSADICCSVAITLLGEADPKAVLDAASEVTHFGGGGRAENARVAPPAEIMTPFDDNPFLTGMAPAALEHFATQGEGNHFLFVGRLRSSGETAIVTHHGSRKPGAMLYKRGLSAAERHTRAVSPETRKPNSWIPFDSREGEDYWAALQAIRAWTKANHYAIHDLAIERGGLRASDRFWNEHNFVFRRGDMLLHGKGATPAWADYADDASGLLLIPLNMAEPVLIARGRDAAHGLGFCPHGAGRNFSRSEHVRRHGARSKGEIVRAETKGLDVRFHSGHPDVSELPSAYKNAETVARQTVDFGLAAIVDHIDPFGCIMAGDWMAPFRDGKKSWREDRKRKQAERRRREERRAEKRGEL